MEKILPFLMRVMDARDPYAHEHSDQVTGLVASLARQTDLSAERTEALIFAARVHDIGKIAINDTIINKPGRFTRAEYVMVQQHAPMGASLIEELNLNPAIARTILHHHENFDGTGYPLRLKAEEIPLESRILRLADEYDALTHNRIYRPAYSTEQALGIMEKDRVFFDPQLRDIFFRTVDPTGIGD